MPYRGEHASKSPNRGTHINRRCHHPVRQAGRQTNHTALFRCRLPSGTAARIPHVWRTATGTNAIRV
eukprot:2166474-Prymnesium_polylepis.2